MAEDAVGNYISTITMKCDYCNHVEYYEDENSFFQGEMWGLPDESVMCNACLGTKELF